MDLVPVFLHSVGPVLETEASTADDNENASSISSSSGKDLHRQVS